MNSVNFEYEGIEIQNIFGLELEANDRLTDRVYTINLKILDNNQNLISFENIFEHKGERKFHFFPETSRITTKSSNLNQEQVQRIFCSFIQIFIEEFTILLDKEVELDPKFHIKKELISFEQAYKTKMLTN